MNLALAAAVLASAIAVAPEPAPAQRPLNIKVEQGDVFICLAEGGCYIANEAGMDAVIQEAIAATRAQCKAAR